MSRIITLGRQPATAPEGTFREIIYPQLARLDEGTKEGYISRILSSEGANSRDLPRTIYHQSVQDGGHFGSFAVGSLYEITADGETGILSGRGWMADTPQGHAAALEVLSKSLFHNSIDLGDIGPTDIEIAEHGDWWDDDWFIEVKFKRWSLIATTHVGKPAFANAQGELSDLRASLDPELAAALFEDKSPLVVDCPSIFGAGTALELTASMSKLPPYEYFFRPESDIPHKLMVDEPDEHGFVHIYGHLAQWGKPHTGIHGRTVYAPRATDNYSTFCQPGVLTDKGLVNTGPITLFGGHVSLREAADDPRYAFADVRVVDGRHGPWVSGIARPHISHDDALRYVARASRISGHWETEHGPLRMIVCCNAEGFPIDNPWPDGLVASFAVDEQAPNVPSTVNVFVGMPDELLRFTPLDEQAQQRIARWASSVTSTATSGQLSASTDAAVESAEAATEATDADGEGSDDEAAAAEREAALAALDELLGEDPAGDDE